VTGGKPPARPGDEGVEQSAVGRTELGEPPPRVVLYSKPGCHLCDDARAVVAAVCAELGETFDEVDIMSSEELMSEFGEQIPVTFVDGEQHDFWRVDPARLRAALV
jgi:glutaredoxin